MVYMHFISFYMMIKYQFVLVKLKVLRVDLCDNIYQNFWLSKNLSLKFFLENLNGHIHFLRAVINVWMILHNVNAIMIYSTDVKCSLRLDF